MKVGMTAGYWQNEWILVEKMRYFMHFQSVGGIMEEGARSNRRMKESWCSGLNVQASTALSQPCVKNA